MHSLTQVSFNAESSQQDFKLSLAQEVFLIESVQKDFVELLEERELSFELLQDGLVPSESQDFKFLFSHFWSDLQHSFFTSSEVDNLSLSQLKKEIVKIVIKKKRNIFFIINSILSNSKNIF